MVKEKIREEKMIIDDFISNKLDNDLFFRIFDETFMKVRSDQTRNLKNIVFDSYFKIRKK
jgi:hypothetical protein